MTTQSFYTFKEEKNYKNPTEDILVSKIKSIKSEEGLNDKTTFVLKSINFFVRE